MATRIKKEQVVIPVTGNSGNVFADLGVAEPEEELAKAQLASHIRDTINRRRRTSSGPTLTSSRPSSPRPSSGSSSSATPTTSSLTLRLHGPEGLRTD